MTKFKYIMLAPIVGLAMASCNDFLDREPISNVTPNSYFTDVSQLGAYTFNYYGYLQNSRGQNFSHDANWSAGVQNNDHNTDNYIRDNASEQYFANNWNVPAGQVIGGLAGRIRAMNYFIERNKEAVEGEKLQGDASLGKHYLGEAYFLRAVTYFIALTQYGDFPIVENVLKDDDAELKAASARAPRNEVARFILADLDRAVALLKDKGFQNNLRINKQVALLFKSRVALFEGTFEKYHKGTGRVPGDANWPGASHHSGKSFNIDQEVSFFLSQAMDAAAQVADNVSLTENNHVLNPSYGQTSMGNPYFDMFSSVDLSGNNEVLMWKKYDKGLNVTHDAAYILTAGGDRAGHTRSLVNSYLMKNGLPIYAEGSGYQGDDDIVKQFQDRDERLQLFVWNPSSVRYSDPRFSQLAGKSDVVRLDQVQIVAKSEELTDRTGFRARKYTSFDYQQQTGNQNVCYTGAVLFRAVEAYLNYMEACYEKNHSLDDKAKSYWRAVRTRAGVSTDFEATIAATNLDMELNATSTQVFGDMAVYSGDNKVDATLYNIRRERRCEFIGEGMRWDDLIRWRSLDVLLNKKFVIEGMKVWSADNAKYLDMTKITSEGDKPNVSPQSLSMYIRPMSFRKENNVMYDGLSWRKAFYLRPYGIDDLNRTAIDPTDASTSTAYQNPYWPTTSGKSIE